MTGRTGLSRRKCFCNSPYSWLHQSSQQLEERPSGPFGTTQEAAEKPIKFAKYPKIFPQRLKPRTHSMSLSGTDKSVPFQNSSQY
jgi:hypothetical protein